MMIKKILLNNLKKSNYVFALFYCLKTYLMNLIKKKIAIKIEKKIWNDFLFINYVFTSKQKKIKI